MEKEENYISLKEAEEYCPYSADYLKLRARQGKLKANKIGRIWVTKKEWVKEYLEKMEEYKTERKQKVIEKEIKRKPVIDSFLKLEFKQRPLLNKAVLFFLIILLAGSGILFGKRFFSYSNLVKSFEKIDQVAEALIECAGTGLSQTKKNAQKEFKEINSDFSAGLLSLKSDFGNLSKVSTKEGLQLILNSARRNILQASESFEFGISYQIDRLKIGTPEAPKGIVFYDSVTGLPYCLRIENGQIIIAPGECNK